MRNKHIFRLSVYFNSVYMKLILVLFAILIPLFILLIGSNSYAIHIIRRQVFDSYQRQTSFYTQIIDNALSDLDLYLSDIAINNSDFEILQSADASVNSHTLAFVRFNNTVRQQLSLYPLADTFFYYDTDTDYYSTISATDQNYEIKNAVHNYINQVANSSNPYSSDALMHWQPVSFSEEPILLRIFVSENHYIGIWVRMSKLLSDYEYQNAQTGAISAYINEGGTPIVSDGGIPFSVLDYSSVSEGYTEKTVNGKYTIIGEHSNHGNFALVSIIPDSVILNRLPMLSTAFRALSFVLLLILPFSILLLRRILREPFTIMTSSMRRIQEGNLEERIRTDHMSNEFSVVSCIFNEMMDHIRDLKLKIYEEEINRQNETLAHLQMQVKPHFYLNSLSMIYTLARNNDIHLIKDLSMSLIRYFRYVFNESTFVTLSEELTHIRNYLRIQELRFPGSFSYRIEIDESLHNVCIPYLLIQNFVENSIKYALTLDEKAELHLLIKQREESNKLFSIQIKDNGPGFSGDILEKIRNNEVIEDHDRKHLGIWNCCRRIQLLYDGDAKIEFNNIKPHGALINITLPLLFPEDTVQREHHTGGIHESAAC